MHETFVNRPGGKRCAFCKYWYDPTNSAISPKNTIIGVWRYDEKAKKLCTKRNIHKYAFEICHYYESKIQ